MGGYAAYLNSGGGSGLTAFTIFTPNGTFPVISTANPNFQVNSNDTSVVITGVAASRNVDLSVPGAYIHPYGVPDLIFWPDNLPPFLDAGAVGNIGLGYLTLSNITIGSYITAVGQYAGQNSDGNYCSFYGWNAGAGIGTGTSATIIGAASNTSGNASEIAVCGSFNMVNNNDGCQYVGVVGTQNLLQGINLRGFIGGCLNLVSSTDMQDFIILGHANGATCNKHQGLVLIGSSCEPSNSSANNEFCVGGIDTPFTKYWLGSGGLANASPASINISPTYASTDDIAGANFTVQGGASTGSANGGKFIIQTSPAGGGGGTSNTPLDAIAADANGNVEVQRVHNNQSGFGVGQIRSGTYTPTISNVANISANRARQCSWKQVGNVVSVYGQVDIDPTTTLTLTRFKISLPVGSSLSTAYQLGGTAISKTGNIGTIECDFASSAAEVRINSVVDVTNQTFTFSFGYEVL